MPVSMALSGDLPAESVSSWLDLVGDEFCRLLATSDATESDPEVEWLSRAISGDRQAFEELYRRYLKKIYNLVYRMVGTTQEAEEVTQEVFFQAYKNLPGFHAQSRFYTWVFRIAVNVSLQYVKRRVRARRETLYDEVPEVPHPPSEEPRGNPEREVEHRVFCRALETAINRLPPNQRAVMILGPIQGHSYEEMAAILGTTDDVIKSRLHRARENIREFLKEAV
ncbi:MAG: sigma-70 family RNA polymerase sigma factor [Candidatus Riflebacteria bacterium]|nr:sigma-70 family RNA polymerase sigma factor [Candidatus Riflebacteria bacterium]